MRTFLTCLVAVIFLITSVCAVPLDITPNEHPVKRWIEDIESTSIPSTVDFTTETITTNDFTTETITTNDFTTETITTDSATTAITVVTTTITTTTTAPLPFELDREWEDFVLAGPSVVNYLGLFMILASRGDQTLDPEASFTIQFIHNVHSLTATISQVESIMQIALQGAHEDLTRIHSSMDQIPEHIQAALLLIKIAPINLLSELLPYTLKNVDRAAKEGSAVSKPILARFLKAEQLLDELARVISSTLLTAYGSDYVHEASIYATAIKMQWSLLVKFFRKVSEISETTVQSVRNKFVSPIQQAQIGNTSSTNGDRANLLDQLIPVTIAIDQSSQFLRTITSTYIDIYNEHMLTQIAASSSFLALSTDFIRLTSQLQLWKDTIAQTVKVARVAQVRQNQFAETTEKRKQKYVSYALNSVPV